MDYYQLFYQQQRYDKALRQYQRTLKMHEKLCPSRHRYSIKFLENIALVWILNGSIVMRSVLINERLKRRLEFHPSGHLEIGAPLDKIGLCHEHLSQFNMATGF